MEEIRMAATKRVEAGSSATSWLFGLGLFLFILGILFLFLLRRKWRFIAYGALLLGVVLMVVAAGLYACGGTDRYCMKNPSDEACAMRYETK
jgi:LPXTG-motif cell wall-anchored protein